jgi:transposase
VDVHTRQQLIKWCDRRDGEIKEQRLSHDSLDEVRSFYPQFTGEVIVGIEACGYSEWFERLLRELGHEVWVGDATKIRSRARSRQKTGRRDAELLLDLLLKNEFPRINRLPFESLEVLRHLRYIHRLVQMRTRMRNSLQAITLGSGIVLKSKLRTRRGRENLPDLPLSPVLSQQRSGWSEMIEEVERRIAEVEGELEQAAAVDERVLRLRTHPGVGLLTGLALMHTLCPVSRFADSRKVTAYVGLVEEELASSRPRGAAARARRRAPSEDAPPHRSTALVARVMQRARTLTPRHPDAAQDRLEAEAGFVLAPDLDLIVRVPAPECRGRGLQLFLNRACSRSLAARAWRVRGTWRLKPRRRIARQAVVSCTGSPVRSSIQAATFGAVHSPLSGAAERKTASSSAAMPATRGGGRASRRRAGRARPPRRARCSVGSVASPNPRCAPPGARLRRRGCRARSGRVRASGPSCSASGRRSSVRRVHGSRGAAGVRYAGASPLST